MRGAGRTCPAGLVSDGDAPESVTPSPADGGFTFAIGDRRFVYDRLGLRRA